MKELSLNILDVVQNSIRAKSQSINVVIEESVKKNSIRIIITDDGQGISEEMLPDVTDGFVTSRTKRKVGLGLPFLRQHAESAGGWLKIRSHEGAGTRVEASFILDHIDRQPMGDIAGVIKILMMTNPDIEFRYKHSTDSGEFTVDTREIKETFEVNSLNDNNLMKDVKSMMVENLRSIEVTE